MTMTTTTMMVMMIMMMTMAAAAAAAAAAGNHQLKLGSDVAGLVQASLNVCLLSPLLHLRTYVYAI